MASSRELAVELVSLYLEKHAGNDVSTFDVLNDIEAAGLQREVMLKLAHFAGIGVIDAAKRDGISAQEQWAMIAVGLAGLD